MKYKTSFTHGSATIYLNELRCEIIQLPRDYIKGVSDNNGTRTMRIGCSFPVSKGIFRTLKAACHFITRSRPNLRHLQVDFNIHGVSEMMARNVELGSLNLYRLDLHLEPFAYINIRTNIDNKTRYFYTPDQGMSGINWKVANHR